MDEQWVPGSKNEIMSVIEKEWTALIQFAESLTDEQMNKPDSGGWSPKDNLAHVTEWMDILVRHHFDNQPAHEALGVAEDVAETWDMQIINPVLFERNKDRTRADVLDTAKQVYRQLEARLNSMSFEEMLAPHYAEDPKKRPLLIWIISYTSNHFKEHRETIEKGTRG